MRIDLRRGSPRRLMVDTSVLIAHLRGVAHGTELMRWAGAAGVPYVSALSILEVAQGMARREEEATRALLDSLEPVVITYSVAWDAGVLLRDLRQQGLTIHLPDALIAVCTLSVGVPLLTHNVRHFERIPDLEVLDAGSTGQLA
ncbi:MAG: type II toxin-antitoxin system VapC family toxin [Limnochordia bacterium]